MTTKSPGKSVHY